MNRDCALSVVIGLFALIGVLEDPSGAQGWEEVGEGSASGSGISSTSSSANPCIRMGPDDLPVVAWDVQASSYVYLKKWNGTSWTEFSPGSASGTGFAAGRLPKIIFNNAGVLYLAWATPSNNVYIMQYDGTAWSEVSPGSASGAGVTMGYGIEQIVVDANGAPALLICGPAYDSAHTYAAFNGTIWDTTADPVSGQYKAGLIIDGLNRPIVSRFGGGTTVSVKYKSGSSWAPMFTGGSDVGNDDTDLTRDALGNPILAYYGRRSPGVHSPHVLHWDGSAWREMGPGSNTDNGIDLNGYGGLNVTFGVPSSNRPVLAWIGEFPPGSMRVYLRRFNGSFWEEMEGSNTDEGVSDQAVLENGPGVAVDSRGAVYVAWTNDSPRDIFVKRYISNPLIGDVTYTYDPASRLDSAWFANGRRIFYDYDAAGNRGSKVVTSQLIVDEGSGLPSAIEVLDDQPDVPMLPLRLVANDEEDIRVTSLTISATGTGDDAVAIDTVVLYQDSDQSNHVSAPDVQLATGALLQDNGSIIFSCSPGVLIAAGGQESLLVAASFTGSGTVGETYSLYWNRESDIIARGTVSERSVLPLGAPILGSTVTISTVASTPVPTNTPADTPTATPTATATRTPTPTNIPPTPPPNTPSPPDLAMGVLDVSPELSLPAASDDDGYIVDYFFVLWREETGPEGTPTVADYRSGFAGRPTPIFQPSEALIRGTTYYWRARAFDNDGDPSVYTALFRFQLATETPTPSATPTDLPVDRWMQY